MSEPHEFYADDNEAQRNTKIIANQHAADTALLVGAVDRLTQAVYVLAGITYGNYQRWQGSEHGAAERAMGSLLDHQDGKS